jgi:6-pyruvoyltetrahydropterin/6-carboxytetrahydropterin synthase
VKITRKIEFDAGHRIPDHDSKCRNAHGHRYVLECSVAGAVNHKPGESTTGMIMDFSRLKEVMNRTVGDPWDHAFLVYEGDGEMLAALQALGPYHNTVTLPAVPTVENLARLACWKIVDELENSGVDTIAVRLYETPNCWADYGVYKTVVGTWVEYRA